MKRLAVKRGGRVVVTLLLGGAALLLLVAAYGVRQNLLQPLAGIEDGRTFRLEPGVGLRAFAQDLQDQALVPSARWLFWYARLTGGAATLKSGEYRIDAGITPLQLLARVQAGDVVQHAITFVEGWRFARWRQELAAQDWLRQVVRDLPEAEVMARLQRPGQPAEGLFFPDTYRFSAGVSDLQVLRAALERMDRVLAEEWAARDPGLPYPDPYSALTLASLVELESGIQDDREKIAAVFLRRLERGVRLQSDPTVIYGLGLAFRGDLRRRDLELETPYNTYVHGGLPPTPICSPGRGALHAALHPAAVTSLYFVARGDGSSQFSDTLEEHNRAVRKYQIEQRAARYRSAPERRAPASAEQAPETITEERR